MMKFRKFAELVARNRAFKRRMPKPFRASILVSPDSQLKYMKPGRAGFDPMLLEVVRAHIRPGTAVWDVGANVGVFSVAAASLGASVVAFEPDVWLAALLERTRALADNRDFDFKVVAAAVSNRVGVAEFLIADRGRASNALQETGGRSQSGGTRTKCMVPTLTLDCICETLPCPDFVKIDVEGAELMVLEGATTLLRRRPRLLIEVGANHAQQITRLLTAAGYLLFDASKPIETAGPIDLCTENTLALAA